AIVLAELPVDRFGDVLRRCPSTQLLEELYRDPYQAPRACHEHRSGGALPRHVGDQEAKYALRRVEKVVEIAADLTRGFHERVHSHGRFRRPAGKFAWQHAELEPARRVKLLFETLQARTHLVA